ncbi:phosphatidylinositol 4-phosphate 5-kinase 1-like isoform X1 [Typha angustifolia]|uniref:phosphatidylinositol 4-phosphate 5-kinase 1-like isoform X1 n=2 Tax=Typha angustifolia TaxID=59011 RepID=UPI003C2D1FA2
MLLSELLARLSHKNSASKFVVLLLCSVGKEFLISCSFILTEQLKLTSTKLVREMSYDDSEREGVLSNGDIYVGTYDGVIPHGLGKYLWFNGTLYDGSWDKGKITGKGLIHWPSGATYEGDFCGGFLHGAGTYNGTDGSTYRGSWRMNIQHGMGTKTYSNSDNYEGSWKEGLQEGFGNYNWSNGNTYKGNWRAGKMSGKGLMKWSTGDLFDGDWLDGLMHGTGHYKYADGSYYIGTWSKGLKDGRGTFYPTGNELPHNQRSSHCLAYDDDSQGLSVSSSINSEKSRSRAPYSQRCKFGRWNISKFFLHSGRVSNRTTSLDPVWDLDDNARSTLSQENNTLSSCDGQHELQGQKKFVYEREYIQGVLIMESRRDYDTRVSQETKLQHMSQRQARGPGEIIYKGHKSYYLMLNLQLGIRYTVGKITPVPMREVRSSDFGPRARIKMYFPSGGSQYTPPHNSIGFFWKDYCPMVFRNLREMFKIDAADYMMSICGGDGLKELSSPGKSGSIFYLSQDERFVIKTLRRHELKVLLKMLPSYYNHVGAYDNTLITKFFGLHRITIGPGRKVRFVVMGNMFCTELRIHRRYDLKGSLQGRLTNKQNISGSTTMKDLDLSYVFYLEKSWRESLFRQISLDCMFLESQCIIDYSMLLGLHFRAPEHLKTLLENQDTLENNASFPTDTCTNPLQEEVTFPPKGFCLVAHEPGSGSTMPGSHIRGSMVRASEAGDEEVDLVLPDTGRLRVQLGVNMPAQANRIRLHEGGPESEDADLYEVYDVVLYLGIIDILQEYNMTKRIEHTFKSLKFDPLSISAIEPRLYSKRFITFLGKVFPVQL